jgi:hypothetical protein
MEEAILKMYRKEFSLYFIPERNILTEQVIRERFETVRKSL